MPEPEPAVVVTDADRKAAKAMERDVAEHRRDGNYMGFHEMSQHFARHRIASAEAATIEAYKRWESEAENTCEMYEKQAHDALKQIAPDALRGLVAGEVVEALAQEAVMIVKGMRERVAGLEAEVMALRNFVSMVPGTLDAVRHGIDKEGSVWLDILRDEARALVPSGTPIELPKRMAVPFDEFIEALARNERGKETTT